MIYQSFLYGAEPTVDLTDSKCKTVSGSHLYERITYADVMF